MAMVCEFTLYNGEIIDCTMEQLNEMGFMGNDIIKQFPLYEEEDDPRTKALTSAEMEVLLKTV